MKATAPIINYPAIPPMPVRIGWQVVAVLMWTLWLTCWVPLATFATWELGLFHLNHALLIAGSLRRLQECAMPFLIIIGLQSGSLLIWAGKEYFLFGRRQRRQKGDAASLEELARYSCLREVGLSTWQKAQCVVVEHDEHGRFQRARVLSD